MVSVMPDTTLCMIVRDEMENPAGGIKRFLDTNLPRFSDAVIVDTGSVDGTRETLEDYQARYPQLRVYDRTFDGYHHSRNMSLRKARMRRALVLDADEHIRAADWEALVQRVNANPTQDRWHVDFIDIHHPELATRKNGENGFENHKRRKHTQRILHCLENGISMNRWQDKYIRQRNSSSLLMADYPATINHSHNPRLFDIGTRRYHKAVWEALYEGKPPRESHGFSDFKKAVSIMDNDLTFRDVHLYHSPQFAQVAIYHFKAGEGSVETKQRELYGDKNLEELQSETRKDELNWLMWELAWRIPPVRICLRASRIPRTPPPSNLPNNHLWRAYNPLRDQLE